MKVYHLVAKEVPQGMEISASCEGEEQFNVWEIVGILTSVTHNLLDSMNKNKEMRPPTLGLVPPSRN